MALLNLIVVGGVIIFILMGTFYFFVLLIKISQKESVEINNNPEKAINSLVKEIDKAKNFILIVSGHANASVYNNNRVRKAFEDAFQRIGKENIKVIAGPEIYIKDGENGLVELAKKDKITLAIPREQQRFHFRCIDYMLYDEAVHPSGDHNRKATFYRHHFDKISEFKNKFQQIFSESRIVKDLTSFQTSPQN